MITRRSVFTKIGAALCGLFVGRASGATSAAKPVGAAPFPVEFEVLGGGGNIKCDILYRKSATHPGEIEFDGILHADNQPFSGHAEVFDRNTGEVQKLVQSVHVKEGWIDQITTFLDDAPVKWAIVNGKSCLEPCRALVIHRIYGNWGLRYKKS